MANIGEEFDINFGRSRGGIVPDGMDLSGFGMSDEEIARRMQAEEFNPEVSTAADFTSHALGDLDIKEKFADLHEHFDAAKDRTLEKQRQDLERRNKEVETLRREQEMMKREQETLKRERDLEKEHFLVEQRANQLSRLRNYNTILSDGMYTRIYDWGIGLIPDYYTYAQRRRMENVIESLIKRELRAKSSEAELEGKIRDIIREETPRPAARKASARRPAAKKSPKKKSTRKASAKKSTRKASKKASARKSTRKAAK
jgi:hypothetical protein